MTPDQDNSRDQAAAWQFPPDLAVGSDPEAGRGDGKESHER